ncbi:MAG: M20/M25/M40 family metallo-hydrolase [Candidatus Bathyarchaeota archaeon]|nr:MAG: M20/M25/M40 family metallo-hydrolase [Candidatus Bathyarchaeota archaeon]
MVVIVDPYGELDRRILGEVYGSTETMENIVILCDEYGSRWPGSGDDLAACEYMVGKREEYSLESSHLERFTHPGWIRGSSTLTVVEPVEREIPCIALPMSCRGEAEADLVFLGDGPVDVYEKRKEEIEGSIVIVTSRTPLGMTRALHRSEKYQRSVLAGASGWIFMNHYPAYGPPTGGISPIIPAVGVSYEDGHYLARLLKRKGRVRVRVETDCENLDVETWNVVADLPGSGEDNELLVYGAHYEGHDIAVGALDDATGAACVMEVARVLSKEREHLKRPMRFLLFGSEEIGLLGSRAYVDQHPEELERIRFMLNFDAAGRAGRQGFNLCGHPELEPLFHGIAEAIGVDIPVWQSVSPYSDHWPFLLKGVPTGRMGDPVEARRRGGRGFGHTMHDTVDKADLRAQRECVANSAIAAVRIANADDWPAKHRSKEEIDALVQRMGYGETVALGGRVKDYLSARRGQLRPETKVWLERMKASWDEVL